MLYAFISFGLPIVPVILAYSQGVTGIPVSYIKGLHTTKDSIKSSGMFFIPPIIFLLVVCACKLAFTYYGLYSNKLFKMKNNRNSSIIAGDTDVDFDEFMKAKQT